MASKRIYPHKECANPECEIKFQPHDRRQAYCTRQCQINAANDRRWKANNKEFRSEKLLRIMDKKLEEIYESNLYQQRHYVTKDILEHEGIILDLCVLQEINRKTHHYIRWYYRYGLESINSSPVQYEIHHRTKFNNA